MQDIKQFLSGLGLTDKQSTIYLASLKYGPQTASTLSRKTGMPRSTVIFTFNELIQKGFVSRSSRQNATYLSALKPSSIEYMLMEKAAETKKQLTDFKMLLPFLSSLENKFSQVPKVQYYEGVEGLCRMLDDFCAVDQTVLYISGHNMMDPRIREYTYNVYLPISNKHENKNKIILSEGPKSREYEKVANKAYDEFIFADPKKFPLTSTTAIYGNKTAFWSYDPKDMTGVIIENQLIADQMRTLFKAFQERLQEN